MAKVLRVFEHERITTKEGRYHREHFTKEVYDAFRTYHRANDNTPFFELIDQGVKFKQYVGAIQVGKTTIEILPKAGKQGDADTWQSVLLQMLKKCHLLTAQKSGKANLRLKSNSILDLYFEIFLNELEILNHKGLIKKYRKENAQVKSLKGSIQFSQHLNRNLVRRDRFYTSHSIYDKNHLANQVLFKALEVINQVCSSPTIKDRIGRLMLDFPEVSNVKVQKSHFDQLSNDRRLKDYEEALAIAKLLILNLRPDLKHGREDLLAIMFDMNLLWEEYIFRVLQQTSSNWSVSRQNKKTFWKSVTRTKTIRPDIVLRDRGNNRTLVIDTKWKVINADEPGDDDLKQMYVYNHFWEAEHSMLLFPKSGDQVDKYGTFESTASNEAHHCLLGFVDVLENDSLSMTIGKQVLEKVEKGLIQSILS